MSYSKTIVCLANSRKPPSGRCIAGREVSQGRFGDWIRPVSARSTQEISEEERRYQNGSDPKVLDVVTIELQHASPHLHQQENHLIDAGYYWVKQRTVSWSEIQHAVDSPAGTLWVNNSSSSNGENDRVAEDELDKMGRSLYLVKPNDLKVIVQSEGGDFSPARRRVRAKFKLSGQTYCIVVTDPVAEAKYLSLDNGHYSVTNALICVSLGEAFKGFAYKLAAAVITP